MRRLGALAILLAAACNFTPTYVRPAAPVVGRFPGTGTVAAADQGWRTMFGDPRLQTLIGMALHGNRDLRIASLNVEATRAQFHISTAPLFPTVGGTARGNFLSANIPTLRYQVGLTASYELDLFGRIRSLRAAALHQYLASEEAQRAAHLALVGEVVATYLRERAYDEERLLAEETVKNVGEVYDLTKRMLEAGSRSELDVRAAEGQLAGARAEVARLTRLRLQTQNALALLVGEAIPDSLPAGLPLESQQLITDLGPGVPSEVLLRRPDVLAAEHVLQAANANIGAARAAFFPTISLTGFLGFASTELAKLFTNGLAWNFTPVASAPLFTGGANTANLELAKVRKRIEIVRYENTIQVAFREVADALVARQYLEEQLAAQQERVEAEQKRYQISQERYRGGIESYLVVLDSQRDLYVAQNALIEIRLSKLQNLADLYRALGGGWKER